MGPVGLPLLSEGSHALLLILGSECSLEDASLKEQTLRESHFVCHVHTLFGHCDRRRRLLSYLPSNLECLINEVVSINDSADKSSISSFLSIHHVTSQDHFHGSTLANGTS